MKGKVNVTLLGFLGRLFLTLESWLLMADYNQQANRWEGDIHIQDDKEFFSTPKGAPHHQQQTVWSHSTHSKIPESRPVVLFTSFSSQDPSKNLPCIHPACPTHKFIDSASQQSIRVIPSSHFSPSSFGKAVFLVSFLEEPSNWHTWL